MSDEIIKICENHLEYQVPLICTFAFKGAEYWCPYCGYTGGIFGSGENVSATETLHKRHEKYKELSDKYLSAHAILRGGACIKYKGKITPAEKLPQSMIDNHKKNLKWEYHKKID